MPEYNDISTAPRDGTRIALLRLCGSLPPMVGFMAWEECDDMPDGGFWACPEGQVLWANCKSTGPTHWSDPAPFDYGIIRASRVH